MVLYQLSPALTFEYILASFFYSDEAPLMNFFSCPSDAQCLLGSKPSVVVHTSGPSALEPRFHDCLSYLPAPSLLDHLTTL